MNLTYKVSGKGYIIYLDGVAWVDQTSYNPYPRNTLEESAQAHIDEILKESQQPSENLTDIEKLKKDNLEINQSLSELTMFVAYQDEKINLQNEAISELTMFVAGGDK